MFFTDKYAIKYNHDLSFNIDVNNKLNLLSEDPSLQHIILYGPEGSGKKTLINLFLKQLYGDSVFNIENSVFEYIKKKKNNEDEQNDKVKKEKKESIPLKRSQNHLVINANTVKNNNILIDIIKNYTSTYHFKLQQKQKIKQKFNEIVLYDIDKLSKNLQLALRRCIETSTKYHRYIFTCTNINSIIEPILSRCIIIKVLPPSDKDLLNVILKISTQENYLIDLKDILKIIYYSHHNISRCILLLESLIKKYNINDDYQTKINRLLYLILNTTLDNQMFINEIKNTDYTILSSHITYSNVIEDILKYFIISNKFSIKTKKEIIKQSSYFDLKCLQCNNKNTHLSNFIINIALIIHNDEKFNENE